MNQEWKVGLTVLHVAEPAKIIFEASLAASPKTSASITYKVCQGAWEVCCLGQEIKVLCVLMVRGLTWWRMRTCACHAARQAASSSSALPHGPHAPGSASRQRLGESHQVAPGEDRLRHLTWALEWLASVSDAACACHYQSNSVRWEGTMPGSLCLLQKRRFCPG